MALIIVTSCGCVSVITDDLVIIDWNRLPETGPFQILSLRLASDNYPISITFASKDDILSYLNSTFIVNNNLDGIFAVDTTLTYSNPESFSSGEIMAILETNMIYFDAGTPPTSLNVSSISVSNQNTITDASLIGVDVLQVSIGSNLSEPITASGWLFDSVLGKITFPSDNYPQDIHVYVLVKQTI